MTGSTQIPTDRTFTVTKIEAAQRQLDCAIELWIDDKDEVSVHTLVAAAYQIIHDVNQHRATGKTLYYDSKFMRDDARKWWLSLVKEPINFFKHADRDPDGAVVFNPFWNLTFMLFGILGLHTLGHPLTDRMTVLQNWVLLHRPDLVDRNLRERFFKLFPVEEIESLRQLNKRQFFDTFIRVKQGVRTARERSGNTA